MWNDDEAEEAREDRRDAGERGRPRGAEASRAAHDNKQGNVLLIAEICQCLRMASWLAILNGRLPTETYRCGRQRSDRGPEAATRSRERGRRARRSHDSF